MRLFRLKTSRKNSGNYVYQNIEQCLDIFFTIPAVLIEANLTNAVFCQVHETGLLGTSLKKEADETMFLELTLRCYDHSRLRDDAPTPRTNQRYIHLSIVFYSAMDFFIDAPLRWVPVIQAIGVDSIPLLDFVSSMWSIEFWKLNTRIFVHFAE